MSAGGKLTIPTGIANGTLSVGAQGDLPGRLLKLMAELLRLPPEAWDGDDQDITVVIRPRREWLESGATELTSEWTFPGRFVLRPSGGFAIELEPIEGCRLNTGLAVVRFAMIFAGAAAMLAGRPLAFLHGSAVRFPESGDAALFFGPSGIGKSTAMRRFVAQGGCGVADDMLLLSRNDRGELTVQPLPTWSNLWDTGDYHQGTVPVTEAWPVRAVIELQRGEGDRIVPCPSLAWKVNLLKALHNHPGAVLTMLPEREKRILSAGLLQFTDRMAEEFPPARLLGDLNGELRRNLAFFCRKGFGDA